MIEKDDQFRSEGLRISSASASWNEGDERHRDLLGRLDGLSRRWWQVIASGRWCYRDEPALGRCRRTMDGPDGGRHSLATGGRPADGRMTVTSSPRRAVGPNCGVGPSGRLWAVLRDTKPFNHHCCHHCRGARRGLAAWHHWWCVVPVTERSVCVECRPETKRCDWCISERRSGFYTRPKGWRTGVTGIRTGKRCSGAPVSRLIHTCPAVRARMGIRDRIPDRLFADSGKRAGRRDAVFGIALRVFVPYILWKFWDSVTSGQAQPKKKRLRNPPDLT